MSDLATLKDRIRTHMFLNGLHPIDWYEDFDRLRSGRVSVDQFRRSFEFMKFQLTAAEFNSLVDEFSERGQVSYRRFIYAVENIFSNRNLEKTPTDTTIDSRDLVLRTQNRAEPSDDDQLQALIAKLGHQVVTRGVHVREAFMDFDLHNNGRVTQAQFFRALPFRDLSASELRLLQKRYADPILRDVCYKRLHHDVTECITQSHPSPTSTRGPWRLLPHQLQSIKVQPPAAPSDALLTDLAAHVREQRIRIREFFQGNDPLNVGVIPIERFKSVLTLFGFPFTDPDLQYLAEKYREDRERTVYARYREFASEVESIADGSATTPVNRGLIPEMPALAGILEKVRAAINRSRINVLPTLQAFDRQKRGFITAPQFHRALSTLKISISIPELNVLAAAYGHGDEFVDYFRFIEEVDPDHRQSRRSFEPIGTTKDSIEKVFGHTPTGDRFVTQEVADSLIYQSKRGLIPKVNEHKDINSLLLAMKRWSVVNSVLFQDFLQDFDQHRIGEIHISQFRSGMSMSKYQLTEDEYDCIFDNYHSETRPEFIRWRQFCDDIMIAVAPKDLEATPQVTPDHPRTFVERSSPLKTVGKTPGQVTRIVHVIARFAKSRRISLMEQFKVKDPMNHRKVTSISFAQVIQLLGVHVSKQEIDTLCTFYNDPTTNFVDYVRFVNDVNAEVGEIFGDRANSSIVVNPIPSYGNEDSPYLVSRRSHLDDAKEWPQILERLQTFVYKRRIRLLDFFVAFDFHHIGQVARQKFHSVVGQVDLPLSGRQIQVCLEKFTVAGTDDLFNYRAFCTEVDEIFGVKELQKTPLNPGATVSQALPDPSSTLQPLSQSEEAQFAGLIERMRSQVSTRRMNIKEQFMDYDRKPRKSFITKQQFKQSIARLGLVSDPAEFDLLCKKYRSTDLDDMNYQAFCHDIDPQ
jgi:Ca2+-binding EF-hand superfamily protein